MKEVLSKIYPPTLTLSVSFFSLLVAYILTKSLHMSLIVSLAVGVPAYLVSKGISECLLMK